MRFLITFLIILFSHSVFSSNEKTCNDIIDSYSEIYQEEQFKNGIICVYLKKIEDSYATIEIFVKNENDFKSISYNSSLLDENELAVIIISPKTINDNNRDFQVLFEYSNISYVIELKIEDSIVDIEDIFYEHRLNYLDRNNEIINLSFSMRLDAIKKLSFNSLNINDIFSPKNMELDLSKQIYLKVNTDKSYLYEFPNKESKTKMYLIQGDWIKVIDYKDNWLLISYKTKNNKLIKKWISMIDVI